ncbi:WxL domain-containing protein [Bombilactobacillus bombi]|uniref:WxL domain-containing protein n=1 Tax=Bombilactobacillus bombi TaxID=1303590 RepID=UPI0035E90E61
MRIKEISMATSALAMFGVVAPLAAQTVNAANPSSALEGQAGVTDYSGSEILNNSASADANGSGKASGLSHAGIGFESDDLILYQVPNFDFGKNNKIGVGTFDMLDSVPSNSSNRMAVIVDNRFTDPGAIVGSKKYNWTLSAQAGDFTDTTDPAKTLDTTVAKIVINDSNSKGKVQYNKPKDQNGPHSTGNIYAVDGTPGALPTGLSMGNDIVISGNTPANVAVADDNTQPGATGLVFSNKDSAVLQTIAGGTNKLVPNHVYVAPITWTLTASPLQ